MVYYTMTIHHIALMTNTMVQKNEFKCPPHKGAAQQQICLDNDQHSN